MKEDYLWNKTGNDPEIEKLENALKAFRYTEIAPPGLPAKIIPFEKKSPRGFSFRLSFAFTSLAAIAVVCFGAWFQFSDVETEIAKDSPKIIALPSAENVERGIPAEKTSDFAVKDIETPKKTDERKAVKIKKIVPQIVRREKAAMRSVEIKKVSELTAQNREVKQPEIKLTKEEKYAYDQLMLALSVTSSKLRLVKDKIEGIEDRNAVLEEGQ